MSTDKVFSLSLFHLVLGPVQRWLVVVVIGAPVYETPQCQAGPLMCHSLITIPQLHRHFLQIHRDTLVR